ncbi:MAG TPA: PepSY domain-containing protein [Azospirillum sp.]|nr:PepSY domain-containing protein [Azospirillum sp.]
MTIKTALVPLALAAALLTAAPALAGPTCTDAPKDTWLGEGAMKQKIADMGYKDIRVFKVTQGNCYEIYGFDKDGKRAEVYFHPVTGAIVEAK